MRTLVLLSGCVAITLAGLPKYTSYYGPYVYGNRNAAKSQPTGSGNAGFDTKERGLFPDSRFSEGSRSPQAYQIGQRGYGSQNTQAGGFRNSQKPYYSQSNYDRTFVPQNNNYPNTDYPINGNQRNDYVQNPFFRNNNNPQNNKRRNNFGKSDYQSSKDFPQTLYDVMLRRS